MVEMVETVRLPNGQQVHYPSADEHDTLVDAHCDLLADGSSPSSADLAGATGLPEQACAQWIEAGRVWPHPMLQETAPTQ